MQPTCNRHRWGFTEEDLLRLGMLEEAAPPPDLAPDASLSDAFVHFLDREVLIAEAEESMPSSPGAAAARNPGRAVATRRTPGASPS